MFGCFFNCESRIRNGEREGTIGERDSLKADIAYTFSNIEERRKEKQAERIYKLLVYFHPIIPWFN